MKTPTVATIFLSILLGTTLAFAQFEDDDFDPVGLHDGAPYQGPPKPVKIHVQPKDGAIAVPTSPKNPSETEQIRQKLEVRTTLELTKETTFADLFRILKEKHDIQAILDRELGFTTTFTIVQEPFRLENVPLRRILQMILRAHDLTYVIDEGFLLITSEDESKEMMKVKVYPAGDLIFDPYAKPSPLWVLKPVLGGWGDGPNMIIASPNPPSDPEDMKMVWEFQPDVTFDFDELMDLIEAVVAPDSWDEWADMVEFYPGLCLVVRQTDEVHDQIENLLAELRAKRVKPTKKISESKTAVRRRGLFTRMKF